jgi:O-antigen/teichoic acid export membrane protein
MLGSAGAGLLRLARESTKIISKPGALLRQVLFPDLVRMWVRGTGAFRLVLIRALIFAVLFGLLFVLASMFGGSALLAAALGEDYAAAAPLMTLLLLAATIELMATVLRAAGYAIGDADTASYILKLHLLSSTVYLTLFATLTPKFNLIGPGIAACIAALIPLGGIGVLVVKGMRDQQAPTAPRPR